MKKKNPEKLILYRKYLEEHRAEQEVEEIRRTIIPNAEKKQIIVKKVSTLGKAMEIVTDLFFRLIRIVVLLVVMGLISFAITILVNVELRNTVFEIMKDML